MKCNDKIMDEIIKFAKKFYEQLDFAHNFEHGKRVVRNARRIMDKEENADEFLVEAGAWLHQFHDNLEEVKEFIDSLNLEQDIKNKLYEIAKCRPSKITEESLLEAKIVYDADAIEVLSAYGMIREIICNVKARDKNWENAIKDTMEVQKRFREKLMTNAAKEMLEKDFVIIDEFWKSYENWLKLD